MGNSKTHSDDHREDHEETHEHQPNTLPDLHATTVQVDEKCDIEESSPSTPPLSNLAPESGAPSGVSGAKYWFIMGSLTLAAYLVNLERVIVATGLPVTASKFDALDQAAWIVTTFLVTQGACMMVFAQILTVWSGKWTFVGAMVVFSLGNLLCAVAWNFVSLIIGRAISGIGAGGTLVTITILASSITKLEQRPILFAVFGAAAAVANISGPLIGGAFVDHVSWRWCFYISLPPVAVNVALIVLLLDDSQVGVILVRDKQEEVPFWRKFLRIDWIGVILASGMIFALLGPLQVGGVTMSWSDKRTIILLCMFGVIAAIFLAWEKFRGSAKAVLPLVLFTRPTTIALAAQAALTIMLLYVGHFFLPLYYQAARERTAIEAGMDILPFLVGTVAGTLGAAFIVKRTGRPWPFLFASPLVASLTAGLIFWVMRTGPKQARGILIVLQILYGLGTGAALQQPLVYIQAEYRQEPSMMPQVTAMIFCMQVIGGAIGVAIAGAILNLRIPIGLGLYVPDLPPDTVQAVSRSVTAILTLEPSWKEPVKRAYAEAIGYVFLLCIPAGIATSAFALIMQNLNLKS